MNTIGIRAEPHSITFAIFDSVENQIVNVESIKVPRALKTPDALKYIRNNILDVLLEYNVMNGCIRIAENFSQNQNTTRTYIEGVIQESFASSNLKKYLIGQVVSISSKLGIESGDFKKYINGEIDYEAVENWNQHSKVQKEAIFAAIGAKDV